VRERTDAIGSKRTSLAMQRDDSAAPGRVLSTKVAAI